MTRTIIAGQPVAIPAPIFPSDAKLAGEAEHAQALHNRILELSAALREVDVLYADAVTALREADAKLTSQVSAEKRDAKAEVKLAESLEAARVAADPRLHSARRAAAEQRLR